ncbi:hypothetical protein DSECCO2_152880 [anaerobic digester metagenome]
MASLLLVKAEPLAEAHQRGFRGIAHLAVFVHRRVAAKQGGAQQRLLQGIAEIRLFYRDDLSFCVELLHGHLVLRQGACFIRADNGYAAQAFHCLQFPDNRVFLRHLSGAEGEDDGDDGGKRLRNGRHGQRHGEEERVHHRLVPHEYADGEQDAAENQDAEGELFAKLVKAYLQRRLLFPSGLQQRRDAAHLRVHSHAGDQKTSASIGDEAAGVHHVLPVAQRRVSGDLLGVLFHRQTLTGEGAFVRFQRRAVQQPPIGAHCVARVQTHHVAHGNVPSRNFYYHAVPQHFGRRGGHPLETFQRCGGLHGLNRAQHRVHRNDR